MNPFALIKEVYDASQAGEQLAKPETWSNRASIIAYVTIFITVALAIINQFMSNSIELSTSDITSIATSIAGIAGLFVSNKLHVASNKDAGNKK